MFSKSNLLKLFKNDKNFNHHSNNELNETAYLNYLPLEVLIIILRSFNMYELLTIRLVSKKFKMAVNRIKIEKLIFKRSSKIKSINKTGNDDWFTDNENYFNYVIKFTLNKEKKLIKFLTSSIINCKNVKYLRIEFKLSNIDILNFFINLEHLVIYCLFKNSNIINRLSIVESKFSNSLTKLEVRCFDEKIFEFKNLELLSIDCTNCDQYDFINLDFIYKLPKLKIIKFSKRKYPCSLFEKRFKTIYRLIDECERIGIQIYFGDKLILNKINAEYLLVDFIVEESLYDWIKGYR